MHETGLCEAVLGVVREVSDDAPVRRVRLRVGRLHGVVPDVFEMCWRMVAQDTGAADAALELQDVAALVRCRVCGAEHELNATPPACPACGSYGVEVVGGDALEVEEVELVDGEVIRNPALAGSAEAS
jgi:hydrogenase nickel incorporation protein HypA/HybF